MKPVRLGPLGYVRPEILAGGAAALVLLIVGVSVGILLTRSSPAPNAHLVAQNLQSVKVQEPIGIKFSRPVDLTKAKVSVSPAVATRTQRRGSQELLVAPVSNWTPKQTYTLRLSDVPDQHHSTWLRGYHASFTTQPLVGVLGFTVDGQPANGAMTSDTSPLITARFATPMKVTSVQFLLNGQALAPATVAWDPGQTVASVTLPSRLLPYHQAVLQVPKTGHDKHNNPMTAAASLTLSPLGLEPANTVTGIGPGFKTVAPVMVVIENAPGSLPSHGLQGADMVFEYLSEYGITRMTALFFNQVSPELRSVRSCRMINLYLDFGFDGLHMCSGASVGTLHWLFGHPGVPVAPGTINDFDRGGHFFRCGGDAPHNLCTDAGRALRLRSEWKLPTPNYLVDPPHADNGLGTPAGAPSVPQHCQSYTYDGGSQQYLLRDHGAPYVDANTGQQVHVKNVVVMNVTERWAGWVEDENGGAGSVWYNMLGSGPAQIYSDGKVIQATWHFGDNLNLDADAYWLNNEAPYFTDQNGNLIELNSGLTWIHVIGNRNLNGGC